MPNRNLLESILKNLSSSLLVKALFSNFVALGEEKKLIVIVFMLI